MALIVTLQDDQDPYGRHAKAVQREDGAWSIEYFKPGGLHDTAYDHGDLIGFQSLHPEDDWTPGEADVVEFMRDVLADREKFGGIFPDAGYQRPAHRA